MLKTEGVPKTTLIRQIIGPNGRRLFKSHLYKKLPKIKIPIIIMLENKTIIRSTSHPTQIPRAVIKQMSPLPKAPKSFLGGSFVKYFLNKVKKKLKAL